MHRRRISAYGRKVTLAAAKRLADGARRKAVVDTVLAGGWLLVGVMQLVWPDLDLWEETVLTPYRASGFIAWVLVAGVCGPVWWWRRSPAVAFAVSWTSLLGLVIGDYLLGLLPFVAWVLMYGVGLRSSRRTAAACVAYVFAGLTLALSTGYPNFDIAGAGENALLLCGCLTLGMLSAATRRNAGVRVELAERRADLAAEREHTAVVEERLRLAQELHDVVAHSMSVINIQASMGAAAFRSKPEHTERALVNIEQTSRATLVELRGLLGVLRADDGARRDLSPAPSLLDIDQLVANVESAGIEVTLTKTGPMALPLGVGTFAYRIVQEALTNVLKHAHASHVDVAIDDNGSELEIRVRDDGRGFTWAVDATSLQPLSPPRAGHGLVGMNERVATFGGSLKTGPAPGGGFQIIASMPYTNAQQVGGPP